MCETGGRVRASGRVKLLGPDESAPERRESVRATWTPLLYLGALGRPRATPRRRTSVTRNACSRSDALVSWVRVASGGHCHCLATAQGYAQGECREALASPAMCDREVRGREPSWRKRGSGASRVALCRRNGTAVCGGIVGHTSIRDWATQVWALGLRSVMGVRYMIWGYGT